MSPATQDGYDREMADLIDRLSGLSGDAYPRQMEAIIALAEQNGDDETALDWRVRLLKIATRCDDFPRMLQAYEGLRRTVQNNPDDEDLAARVRWFSKWIFEKLPGHAEVSREQIGQMFEAVERDFAAAGEGQGTLAMLRCKIAGALGDEEEARRQFELWRAAPTDRLDDCPACWTHATVLHLLSVGEVEAALLAADPIISGKQTCESAPAETMTRLLMPMASLVSEPLADQMYRHVRRQVRATPRMAGRQGDIVLYLTLTGRAGEARRLLPSMLRTAAQSSDAALRFDAFRAAWATLVCLSAQDVERVPLPAGLEITGDDRSAAVPEALVWCAREAADAASRLDARNGNDRYTTRLRNLHATVAELLSPPSGDH